MGEIADYLVEKMMDEGMTYGCRRSRHVPKKKVDSKAFDEETRAAEYPGKNTDPRLLRDYPEKTFDMGFFPSIPKPAPPEPFADLMDEEAPF